MTTYKYEITLESSGISDESGQHGIEISKERFEKLMEKLNLACASTNLKCTSLVEVEV